MGRNATEIERAVARSLRDSLEKLQRNTDEVNQAIGDLVSACASAKPSNTLPHMLRAQTAAASLAATLDVLSRFITAALQPGWGAPSEESAVSADPEPSASVAADADADTAGAFAAAASVMDEPAFDLSPEIEPEPAAVAEALRTVASETAAVELAVVAEPLPVEEPVGRQGEMEVAFESAPESSASVVPEVAPQVAPEIAPLGAPEVAREGALELIAEVTPQIEPPVEPQQIAAQVQAPQPVLERPVFDLASLPADQQELHRRANRVAKVSMQDIKMLRPGDVRSGKENHDLCVRLRDDIERAHKEYERRFHAILGHPVDYFYAWMVEILGEGDPRALGEYPYPSAVARR